MRIAQAPAKINLALHVTSQREDGYHLIDSIVVFAQTLAASDTVIVSGAPLDGFDISGDQHATLPATLDNLVLSARDQIRKSAAAQNIDTPPVHISLEKRLPIASGIGGGSADAAAAIKLLHAHWGVKYNGEFAGADILSKTLGADVPMCLLGAPLRATGVGDKLTRLHHVPALHLVLVNCGQQISTPTVFSRLETTDNPAIFDLPETGFVTWLKDRTRNDLRDPAAELCEGIAASLTALEGQGAQLAQMSGSGATCFGIFETAREAAAAAQIIQLAEPNWWVAQTRTGASPKEKTA